MGSSQRRYVLMHVSQPHTTHIAIKLDSKLYRLVCQPYFFTETHIYQSVNFQPNFYSWYLLPKVPHKAGNLMDLNNDLIYHCVIFLTVVLSSNKLNC